MSEEGVELGRARGMDVSGGVHDVLFLTWQLFQECVHFVQVQSLTCMLRICAVFCMYIAF